MLDRPDEQREPDHRIENNHRYGHHRVSCDGGVLPGPQHDGGNEHHFDQHDRECEDQGTVGITKSVGEMFGLMDHPERADQNDSDDGHECND